MRMNYLLKSIMVVLFIGMGAVSAMAQKNIDKLLEELDKRDDVSINSVVKRDPKTRKVVRDVTSYYLTDEKMAKRLIEAFEKDEEYTITAIKDKKKDSQNMTIANFTFIFKKDNTNKRTYVLKVDKKGKIYLQAIINQGKHGNEGYYDQSFNFDFDTQELKDMERSIQYMLQDLKVKSKNISQLQLSTEDMEIVCDKLEYAL